MQESELAGLVAQVLGSAFAIAVAFGAIAQRTQFCTMGAIADVVHIGDAGRLRMWLLAIGVATVGFNGMVGAGWIEARHTIYAAPRLTWLSHVAGGLMFGFGMVLASGCGSKTLVRLGGGNLKSLVVLLVLGITAYATLRGLTAVWRVATLDRVAITLPVGQDLPSLLGAALGAPVPALALGAGLVLGGALIVASLAGGGVRHREVLPGGIGIGVMVAAMWWVSGRLGHLAEHPVTLEETFIATSSRSMESLSFVAPVAYALDWVMLYSDRSKGLTIGIVSVAGVIVGSALAALASRSFRWEGFRDVDDMANHLVGAALMGVGGVAALGCTIGQGLSGVSTLSIGSLLSLAAIVAGAVLALRWQAWRLERSA